MSEKDNEAEIEDLQMVRANDPITALLLTQLETATAEWRYELGELTDDQIVYQPFPSGHSIGALILHMADVEAYWLHKVACGRTRSLAELDELLSSTTDQYSVNWPTPPRHPLAWYYEKHDKIRARTRSLLRDVYPEDIGNQSSTHAITMRWLLTHVTHHEAYHGGQAVLLSLMATRMKAPV